MKKLPVDKLSISDFADFPVWRFVASDSPDETYVMPMRSVPVRSLTGRIVGLPVRLANGNAIMGIIGNVELENPELTEHFLTFTALRADGKRFHLARYHDHDVSKCGPEKLAAFLEQPLESVFPINYDLSGLVLSSSSALRGSILAVPRKRLTRSEIIALAVP